MKLKSKGNLNGSYDGFWVDYLGWMVDCPMLAILSSFLLPTRTQFRKD